MHIEKREGIAVLTYFLILLVFVVSNLISKADIVSVLYLAVLLGCIIKFILMVYLNKK